MAKLLCQPGKTSLPARIRPKALERYESPDGIEKRAGKINVIVPVGTHEALRSTHKHHDRGRHEHDKRKHEHTCERTDHKEQHKQAKGSKQGKDELWKVVLEVGAQALRTLTHKLARLSLTHPRGKGGPRPDKLLEDLLGERRNGSGTSASSRCLGTCAKGELQDDAGGGYRNARAQTRPHVHEDIGKPHKHRHLTAKREQAKDSRDNGPPRRSGNKS